MDEELRQEILPISSLASTGLPGGGEGAGCIFAFLFGISLLFAFKVELFTKDSGCGGFLEYVALTVAAAAAIAGSMLGAIHGGLLWQHNRSAAKLEPRKQSIEAFLEDSPVNLTSRYKHHTTRRTEQDKHLQEICRTLSELPVINNTDEVKPARKILLKTAFERLVEKQRSEAWLLYIATRRWWNSLEPIACYAQLPFERTEHERALEHLSLCLATSDNILLEHRERIWIGNLSGIGDVVRQGQALCQHAEQVVRRQRANLDLMQEANGHYQFTRLRESLAVAAFPLTEPELLVTTPPKISETMRLSLEGLGSAVTSLWSGSPAKSDPRWLRDLLNVVGVGRSR